jgi:hypothetical protein
LVSIAEAALLSIVTIVAAWSGYSAAKWGTESSLQLAKASATRTKANRAFQESLTFRAEDATMFNAWFASYIAGNKNDARVAERRFRPEYRVAFEAWIATHPFTNPNAPPGPQAMPQYKPTGEAESKRVDGAADVYYAEGRKAGERVRVGQHPLLVDPEREAADEVGVRDEHAFGGAIGDGDLRLDRVRAPSDARATARWMFCHVAGEHEPRHRWQRRQDPFMTARPLYRGSTRFSSGDASRASATRPLQALDLVPPVVARPGPAASTSRGGASRPRAVARAVPQGSRFRLRAGGFGSASRSRG